MGYLLDSNAVIALMAHHQGLRARVAAREPHEVYVSSIVMHELMFGAFNSAHVERNLARLNALTFPLVPFEAEDAREAGRIRAILKRRGTPIGPYDLLIAGQALARGLTVVTANTGEFARVDGLRHENWQAD